MTLTRLALFQPLTENILQAMVTRQTDMGFKPLPLGQIGVTEFSGVPT